MRNLLDFIEDDLKSKLKAECSRQENLKHMNFVIEESKPKFHRFTSFTDSKSLARVDQRAAKRGFQLKDKLFLSSKKNNYKKQGTTQNGGHSKNSAESTAD